MWTGCGVGASVAGVGGRVTVARVVLCVVTRVTAHSAGVAILVLM